MNKKNHTQGGARQGTARLGTARRGKDLLKKKV